MNIQVATTLTNATLTIIQIISAVTIALGIVWFVLAWGLFKVKGWAWITTNILAVISLIISIIAIGTGGIMNVVTLVVNAAIIYFLYRPAVKSYFGRTKIQK